MPKANLLLSMVVVVFRRTNSGTIQDEVRHDLRVPNGVDLPPKGGEFNVRGGLPGIFGGVCIVKPGTNGTCQVKRVSTHRDPALATLRVKLAPR